MNTIKNKKLSELSISALEGFGFSANELQIWLCFRCAEDTIYFNIEGLLFFDVSSDSYDAEISDTNVVEVKHEIRRLHDSEWNKYSYHVDDKDKDELFNVISIYGDLTILVICKGYTLKLA